MLVGSHDDRDVVGNLQAGVLAEVLDAVDEFAGHALLTELVGEFHLECYGEVALVGNEPAGDVLADDFHVFLLYRNFLIFSHEGDGACSFE